MADQPASRARAERPEVEDRGRIFVVFLTFGPEDGAVLAQGSDREVPSVHEPRGLRPGQPVCDTYRLHRPRPKIGKQTTHGLV